MYQEIAPTEIYVKKQQTYLLSTNNQIYICVYIHNVN